MIREVFSPDRTAAAILPRYELRQEESYRPSVFLFPFRHGESAFAYHTLSKQCLQVDEDLFDALGTGRHFSGGELCASGELTRLLSQRFLVPEKTDETGCYADMMRLLRLRALRKRMNSYTILTTTACNARCFYCVEEGAPILTMDDGTARDTVDFILRSRDPGKPVHLTWFGGEPLAAARVIDRVSAALTQAGVDFDAGMVSNGILIDRESLEKMTGLWRIRRIQISLDGEEKEYNRRKNYRHPYPSAYRLVLEVLRQLSDTGIRLAIRCNVDGDNAEGLRLMVDDLARTIRNKANVGLYFAVLFARRNSQEHTELLRRCLEAKLYAREKGFPYAALNSLHSLRIMHCGAENPTGSAVVFPDGALFNCYRFLPEMQTGDLKAGLDRKDYVNSFALPDPVRESCRDCCFLPVCTSFSRCPNEVEQCRETRELELLYDLRCELDRRERGSVSRGEDAPDLLC